MLQVTVNDGNGGTANSTVDVSTDVDFGSTYVEDGTVVRMITVSNNGTGLLLLDAEPAIGGVDDADFSITASPALSIAAGGSTTVEITFDPSSEGSKEATLTIQSNDPDEGNVTINVTGEALAGSTPALPLRWMTTTAAASLRA